MILIVGLIGFDPKTVLQKLFACATIFGLFLIVTLILKKSPGGADIKLSAAVSFVTGLSRSLVALMIGMTLAVVTMTVLSKLKKYDREKPFPLLPFISVGAMIGYLI